MNLDVYVDGWVIEDGNYDHFRCAEHRRFALEFYAPAPLDRIKRAQKRFVKEEDYKYRIVAQVVFSSRDICVLDFGILAYSESSLDLQAQYAVGEFVEGTVTLAVDPFSYFERLAKLEGVPALIYEWHIDSIEQETTPRIHSKVCGRDVYQRDENRVEFRSVSD